MEWEKTKDKIQSVGWGEKVALQYALSKWPTKQLN